MLQAPDTIVRIWKAALRRLDEEAPERKLAVAKIDKEISRHRKEQDVVFFSMKKEELSTERHDALMDRASELYRRIKELESSKKETLGKLVPLQPRQLTRENVGDFLRGLSKKLGRNPEALRNVLMLLHQRHGLQLTAVDACGLRMELQLKPGDVTGESENSPVEIPIAIERQFRKPVLTSEEWAETENEKGHLCGCGCGKKVKVLTQHRAITVGIPKFIQGHHKMSMTEFVAQLNSEGYLTVGQAAKELGVSENTMRRAESKGWISPEWREWGSRKPMRVYRKADLPKLKEQMQEAGFRFKSDKSILTTREMAEAIGISESYLRYLEKKGKIPAPKRDTNGKRMWRKRDVRRLKKKVGNRLTKAKTGSSLTASTGTATASKKTRMEE